MKVAVLGLGRMGHAVARRLLDGGAELVVWNRSPGKAGGLVGDGAHEARSAGEAAESADVVLSSLANDAAVRAVALGDDGVAAHLGDGVYADMSTISPALSVELAKRVHRFVALPVLGPPASVESGDATYLAGGTPEAVQALDPALELLGGRVVRYDRPDMASSGKVCVNLLLLTGVAALAEAMTVGRAGGLSDAQLSELLHDSPMVAPGVRNRFETVLGGGGDAWWTTVLAAKDAGLAVSIAADDDRELTLAPVVRDLYQRAVDAGFADEDMAAVARLYR